MGPLIWDTGGWNQHRTAECHADPGGDDRYERGRTRD